MIRLTQGCVVDASVAIKLFLPEPLAERAVQLFALKDRAGPGFRIRVPGLFYAECANVLWKTVRRLNLKPDLAAADLQELLAMDLDRIPTAGLAAAALKIALERDISVYDGCYVAAAKELGVLLVTADEKLCRKLDKGPNPIKALWLGDLRIPESEETAAD